MRQKFTEAELKNLDRLKAELRSWQEFLEAQKAELNEFLAELLGEPNDHKDRAS